MFEEKRTILRKRNKVRTPMVREVLTFLVFILMAAIFWFVYELSKPREVEMQFQVKCTNLPAGYILSDSVSKSITVKVKDIGLYLVYYKMTHLDDSLVVDLSNNYPADLHFEIARKELKRMLSDKLPASFTIKNIYPRRIHIKLGHLSKRTLPVVIAGKIRFSQQYTCGGDIKINPSEVQVYGPKAILDTMKAVYTEPLNIKNISSKTETTVVLAHKNSIQITPTKVDITIPVELFTEKKMVIPVEGLHMPSNIELRTFPATVSVTFFVGLSMFHKVSANDIHAYVDYNSLINNKQGKQKIDILCNHNYISNIRISNRIVEYILEEKGKE